MREAMTFEQARARKSLNPLANGDGWAVMLQASDAPVIRGEAPDGFDYVCGHCEQNVLVEQTVDGQIWDIAFYCRACGRISASPVLPPGKPAPFGITVPLGQYLIGGTVQMYEGVSLVGEAARRRRHQEVHSNRRLFLDVKDARLRTSMQPHPAGITDADVIEELLVRAKALLGTEYESLAKSYRRGVHQQNTRPKISHRLIELSELAHRTATRIRRGATTTIRADLLGELHASLEVLERWRRDPAWPEIAKSLVDPNQYRHAVVNLATAGYLLDVGNDVGIHVEANKEARAADLRVMTGSRFEMAIEAKAPTALQNPSSPLSLSDARRIISKKGLKSAGTGSRGQLSDERPGLLVLGGFGLSDQDMNRLEAAAAREFSLASASREHIAGIGILSLGTSTEVAINPRLPSGLIVPKIWARIRGALSVRVANNPRYTGSVTLTDRETGSGRGH